MSQVEALLEEREGYVRRGLIARVAQVDACLATFGVAVGDVIVEHAVDELVVETTAAVKSKRK